MNKQRIFEWDEEKAASNYRKHGIFFEDAVSIFQDPNIYTEQDRFENGEYRWKSIGLATPSLMLLLVAHTFQYDENTEIVRIISARRASKTERKKYGNR